MKAAVVVLVLAALISLVLCCSRASAAEETCLQLAPFDDALVVEWVQPAAGVALFIEHADLEGRLGGGQLAYTLEGGGEATYNRVGTKVVMYTTLHNPSLSFWGGNPVCRFHAWLAIATTTGEWAIDCMRKDINHPPFTQAGTLHECAEEVGAAVRSEGEMPLAGMRSLE
jgi:hypothetical protein